MTAGLGRARALFPVHARSPTPPWTALTANHLAPGLHVRAPVRPIHRHGSMCVGGLRDAPLRCVTRPLLPAETEQASLCNSL